MAELCVCLKQATSRQFLRLRALAWNFGWSLAAQGTMPDKGRRTPKTFPEKTLMSIDVRIVYGIIVHVGPEGSWMAVKLIGARHFSQGGLGAGNRAYGGWAARCGGGLAGLGNSAVLRFLRRFCALWVPSACWEGRLSVGPRGILLGQKYACGTNGVAVSLTCRTVRGVDSAGEGLRGLRLSPVYNRSLLRLAHLGPPI